MAGQLNLVHLLEQLAREKSGNREIIRPVWVLAQPWPCGPMTGLHLELGAFMAGQLKEQWSKGVPAPPRPQVDASIQFTCWNSWF